MILWDSLAHWHCTSYIEAAGLPSQGLLYLCHCKALFTHVRKLKKPIPGKSAFFTGAICRCMKGISDKQFSEARKCDNTDKDVLNMRRGRTRDGADPLPDRKGYHLCCWMSGMGAFLRVGGWLTGMGIV